MSNDKKVQASRNPFAEMLNEIQEDNELRKESTSLEKQIDQLRSVIWALEEDQVTVIQASADLDDQLNSIIETSWVIEWTLDDTRNSLLMRRSSSRRRNRGWRRCCLSIGKN